MIQHAGKRCDTTQAATGFLLGSEKIPVLLWGRTGLCQSGRASILEAEIGAFAKGAAAKGFICSSHSRIVWVSEIWDGISGRKKERWKGEQEGTKPGPLLPPRKQRQGDPYCWILSTPVYQRNLKDT